MLVGALSLGLFALLGGQAQAAPEASTATSTPNLSSSPAPALTATPDLLSSTEPAAATPPPTVVATELARPSASPNPSARPALSATLTVTGSTGTDVWTQPVNLSQSGAASQAVIAAEPNGGLDLMWWDRFEGTKYAFYSADKGWSKPQAVPTIIGSRPAKFGDPPGAPAQLRLLADSNHELHAFWIDSRGNLLSAQSRAGSLASWTAGITLATAPLAWDVTADDIGTLHLAYIRPNNTPLLPSGVYYRLSTNGGLFWEDARLISGSLYFRTLGAAAASVSVAAGGNGTVLVAWDDPQLLRSFFARSSTGGKSFDSPVRMEAADVAQSDSVQRTRFLSLPGGQFLRIWQAGANCVQYQQQSDAGAQTWSTPVRVFEALGVCPTGLRAQILANGHLFLQIQVAGVGTWLATWNGQQWSVPAAPRISFVNPVTNQSVALSCIDTAVINNQVAIAGCDNNQDIWASISLTDAEQLVPALKTAWSPPTILSDSTLNADLPAIATEAGGLMHLLWTGSSADAGTTEQLTYARGDGVNWTVAGGVLTSPNGGKAEAPTMSTGTGGSLHAVWSGGFAGEIYYSHAFIRDAATSSGWSSPQLLPAPIKAGASPVLAVDSTAGLHVLYAIPLNESRGIYYTQSADQGATWSAPKLIFDAAAAGWAMVAETHLVIDGHGRLHATWVQMALPPATTRLGVYYSRSEDGGQTWSQPLQVSGVDSGYPILAAAGPDEIHLLWTGTLSGQSQLWHQWSSDGGATWSTATPLLGVSGIAPRASLATDGAGSLYLVGIEQTAQNSAALLYMYWDGQNWSGRESLPLGNSPDSASGASAIVLPDGRLAVFYRVLALTGSGTSHYVLGYTDRPVQANAVITPQSPTATPLPVDTVVPTSTPSSTATPMATLDLNTSPVSALSRQDLWRIGAIVLGMLAVFVVALIGLRPGRR